MPLIQVKLIEGVFSEAQKKEMIKKITDGWLSFKGLVAIGYLSRH